MLMTASEFLVGVETNRALLESIPELTNERVRHVLENTENVNTDLNLFLSSMLKNRIYTGEYCIELKFTPQANTVILNTFVDYIRSRGYKCGYSVCTDDTFNLVVTVENTETTRRLTYISTIDFSLLFRDQNV